MRLPVGRMLIRNYLTTGAFAFPSYGALTFHSFEDLVNYPGFVSPVADEHDHIMGFWELHSLQPRQLTVKYPKDWLDRGGLMFN